MTKKYLCVLLLVLGLGINVSFAQEAKEMPKDKSKTDSSGTYTRKSEKSSDQLALAADKKAVWTIKAEGKEDIVLSGTWDEAEGSVTVTIPAKEGGNDASVIFKVLNDGLEVASTNPQGLLPAGAKFLKDKT